MGKDLPTDLEEKIRRSFNKGCVEYGLLHDGDRILVGLSGGKDSLELTRLLALRSRIFKPRIQVEAAHVVMDPIPYEADLSYLQQFCAQLGIPLHVLHSSFQESPDGSKPKCFLCSWNRRHALFQFAVERGFNKIALGHHMDDILITLLMNLTYEGRAASMPPVLKLEHYPLTVIRPLCLVHEEDLQALAARLDFREQKAKCPYEEETQRTFMTRIFRQLEARNPEARYNLWKALEFQRPPKAPV